MNRILIIFIFALLVIGSVVVYGRQSQSVAPPAAPQGGSQPTVAPKTFNIRAANFSFTPNKITVKQGDRVKVNLTSVGGVHDWVVDEFNARTSRISDGQSASVEFVADKVGTFEFYCSIGNHRQMGMVGKLIVN